MKRLFPIVISLSLISFLLINCDGGTAYQKEVTTLDSLVLELDKAEKAFSSIDTALARTAFQDVNSKLGHINELISDTLDKQTAILLSDFRAVKKPLKEYFQKRDNILQEYGVTRKQLVDLSHDLSKGLLPEKDAEFHSSQEINLARGIISTMELIAESVQAGLLRYAKLNPRMDSLVQVKEMETQSVPIK